MRNGYTDCAFDNNCLYYFLDVFGIPIKENIKENRLEILTSIEGLKTIGGGTYFYTAMYGDCLVGIKQSAESIVMVDTITGEAWCHKLCEGMERWGNIATAFLYKNKLLCYMKKNGLVYEFNCDTRQLEEKVYFDQDYSFNIGIRCGDDVYLVSTDNCIIVKHSLLSGEWSKIVSSKHFIKPMDIKIIDRNLLVLESDGGVILLDKYGEEKKSFIIDAEDGAVSKLCLVDNNEKAIILPCLGGDVYILDFQSGVVSKYADYPGDFCYMEGYSGAKYLGSTESEGYFYYASRAANYSLAINKKTGNIEWRKQLDVPQAYEMKYIFSNNECINETKENDLKSYLNMVVS